MNFTQRMSLGVAAVALMGSVFGSTAQAQVVQSEPLNVTAFIGEACTVSSATLNFGEYEPLSGFTKEGVGEINLECVTSVDVNVALNGGNNPDGGVAHRRNMANNGQNLVYDLFSEAPNTGPWDAGESVTASTSPGNTIVPVYGTIGASQTSAINGAYSDQVDITLTFLP